MVLCRTPSGICPGPTRYRAHSHPAPFSFFGSAAQATPLCDTVTPLGRKKIPTVFTTNPLFYYRELDLVCTRFHIYKKRGDRRLQGSVAPAAGAPVCAVAVWPPFPPYRAQGRSIPPCNPRTGPPPVSFGSNARVPPRPGPTRHRSDTLPPSQTASGLCSLR